MNVYLDNAASSPLCHEAEVAILKSLKEDHANPSAVHAEGQAARKRIEEARISVADLLGANTSEIVFTSGATEANNLAIKGVILPKLGAGEKVHAVTTALEHPSVLQVFRSLEIKGLDLTVVPCSEDGLVNADEVISAVRPETVLVSVMSVNNELGTIQPIAEICAGLKAIKGANPLFHTDAVQGIVTQDVDVSKTCVDLLTISSHKLHGPKGAGALFVRGGVDLEAQLVGGGHEEDRRSGTENTAGISGFGAAARRLIRDRQQDTEKDQKLNDLLLKKVTEMGIAKKFLDETVPTAPNILSLEVPGMVNDFLVLLLSKSGVMVAASAACKSGARGKSAVMEAIGASEKRAKSSIRISFGIFNTEKHVELFIQALIEALKKRV